MSQDLFADDAATAAALQLPPDPLPVLEAAMDPIDAPEPAQPPEAPPEPEQIPEFDPKHRTAFSGLLYVGALTESFSLFGHSFTIATPTQTERLQIGQVMAPYQNTISAEIAYATALVAAFLVDIDGIKLPEPLVDNPKETALHDRFRWVRDNMRKQVIDELFDRCLTLDRQVDDALAAMGKASG